MTRILVTGKIDQAGLDKLQAEPDFQVDIKPHLPAAEIHTIIGDYEAIVTRSETTIDIPLLDHAQNLKLVARGGVGVDNIDLDAAASRGVYVCNTPAANTIAATEQTFSLMLSVLRHTYQACVTLKRDRQWHRTQFTGAELYGKTLGIIGLGRIGSQVAKRAQAFEMNVVAYDPYIPDSKAEMLGVRRYAKLDEMLKAIDILTVHAPKTDETYGMVGEAELGLLRPGSYVINCARGGIIDEQALHAALSSGHLAGAGLDVFDKEPATDHPLLDLDNIVVAPHLGASTREAQRKVGLQLAEQVIGFFKEGQRENMLNTPISTAAELERLAPQLDLIRRLAMMQRELIKDQSLKQVMIAFHGEGSEAHEVLEQHYLQTLLGDLDHPGVEVGYEILNDGHGYDIYCQVKLTTEHGSQLLAGALLDGRHPRLVALNGYALEIDPVGDLLLLVNQDKPGVIGRVGTLLGEAGINIADWRLGRQQAGAEAIALIRCDQAVEAVTMQAIRESEGVDRLLQFHLPA